MTKSRIVALGLAGVVTVAACGGGESAGEAAQSESAATAQPAAGAMTVPEWMIVDEPAKTVTLRITAGETAANNSWNFNGYTNGNATITVPQGYAVTIEFSNEDAAMAHSIGVSSMTANFPPMFQSPQPAFAGGISRNPTDATKATQPNQSETISFTASTAGDYTLVCYVPAHAVSGMWIGFKVSSDGTFGVTTT